MIHKKLFVLGLVIDFMSVPVNAGFTSAAAITIASSQVGALLGIQMKIKSGIVGFVGIWVDVFNNFGTIRAGSEKTYYFIMTLMLAKQSNVDILFLALGFTGCSHDRVSLSKMFRFKL